MINIVFVFGLEFKNMVLKNNCQIFFNIYFWIVVAKITPTVETAGEKPKKQHK